MFAKEAVMLASPASCYAALYAMFDLQMFLLKVLAVAGGGAIGFFGTGLFVRVLGRVFLRSKGKPPAFNTIRGLGMIALGLLVYFWAFGAGGGGFGGAGGWWPFGGQGGTGTDPSLSSQAPDTVTKEEVNKLVQKDKDRIAHAMQVRLLGGKEVVDQRFYLIDDDKQPKSWDEVIALVKKRQVEDKSFTVLEIVLFQGSVDRENPAVTKLENWARENRLTPKLIIHGVDTLGQLPEKRTPANAKD
jgi:hypothetical protein